MTNVTIDDSVFQGRLKKLLDITDKPEQLLQAIGIQLSSSVEKNFNQQKDSQGKRWKPSQRAIKNHGKTLVDTGRLSLIDFSITSEGVVVGTSVDYGRKHDLGLDKMPKRNWLYISEDGMKRVKLLVDKRYKEAIK